MAKFAVIVTSSAHSSYTASAISFIKEIVSSEHELIGVFFYQDGVSNANTLVSLPSDEYQAAHEWEHLANECNVKLHLCITAAEKRGMTDEANLSNINNNFIVSGLGELVELTSLCDRVIQL